MGLDLSARGYPGPQPLRDAASVRLAKRFHSLVHPSVRWAVEVPLPRPGDQRRWDAMLNGRGWRYGVEIETGPRDAQALAGRLQLKHRDGDVDGIILVLPATRRVASFLAAASPILEPLFPVAGDSAMDRLRVGQEPGGNAIVVVRYDVRPPVTPDVTSDTVLLAGTGSMSGNVRTA